MVKETRKLSTEIGKIIKLRIKERGYNDETKNKLRHLKKQRRSNLKDLRAQFGEKITTAFTRTCHDIAANETIQTDPNDHEISEEWTRTFVEQNKELRDIYLDEMIKKLDELKNEYTPEEWMSTPISIPSKPKNKIKNKMEL